MIEPKPLQYDENALEPHISYETIRTHHGKHYHGYVKNLNKLIKGTVYEDSSIGEIIKSASGPIFNNAAQIFNHEFYFSGLTAEQKDINEAIEAEIEAKWGSVDKFKSEFNKVAKKLFGSGWVWLVRDTEHGDDLLIMPTDNAGVPIAPYVPLLVCDVWEHAYYIDNLNDRGAYLDSFWNVVNWDFVNKQFNETNDND